MSTYYLDYENGSDSNDGSNWANAWKTITNGATSARITAGDIIRIAKSPAPVSLGNGTWTNLSSTVTLASAQNATVDNCDSAWTANGSGDTTVSTQSSCKEGSNANRFTLDSSPQTSTMQAYYQISDTDFSSYQKLSFWIYNSAAISANQWYVALCSDTAGATVVDKFLVTAIPSTSRWIPLTLTKDGGGNLGASIQSVAIWTDTSAPTASSYVQLDNIITCTTSGLNLQSLISKNSNEQGGSEGWYGTQSIVGTTVILDNAASTTVGNERGYYGTSETVTTYKRETIKTDMVDSSTTDVADIQDHGEDGSDIEFQGGWDTGTTTQDGETFFDGLNGYGNGIAADTATIYNILLNHFGFVRYYRAYDFLSTHSNKVTNSFINNCNYGLYMSSSHQFTISDVIINNGSNRGITVSGSSGNEITNITTNNNIGSGVYFDGTSNNNVFKTVETHNNDSAGLLNYGTSNNHFYSMTTSNNDYAILTYTGRAYLYNSSLGEATEYSESVPHGISEVYSHDHDNTQYNHWIFSEDATINMQSATTQSGSGYAWKMTTASSVRNSVYPIKLSLAKIVCEADTQVTVKAYCKKDHATDVAAKLICEGGQLDGVASDVTDTKADDTDWEQLSISFTPTENGVVEIQGWAWYVSGNSSVYWDTMDIT